jgi:hypothetical protein
MTRKKSETVLPLIVEKSGNDLWGRITVKESLIVDSASTLEGLKKKLSKLARNFENVEVEDFDISYDLTSFFEQYSYLNISDIAKKTGINPALMRHYASGIKFPSEGRVKEIETAIREIGKELSKVRLHKAELTH